MTVQNAARQGQSNVPVYAFDGATYTDVKAQLPAIYLLCAISLLSVVLLAGCGTTGGSGLLSAARTVSAVALPTACTNR